MIYFGDKLHNQRVKKLNGKIVSHLNRNSIGNKFTCLVKGIRYYIDILMVSPTKIHYSFPVNQFVLDGYIPSYRLDCNFKGDGVLVLIREEIPSTKLQFSEAGLESFLIELNLKKSKWQNCLSYNVH